MAQFVRSTAAVLAVALAARLGFALYAWHRAPLPTGSDGYEPLAISIVERGEYGFAPGVPSARREPGYPVLIAAVYSVFGVRPWALLILQCFLGAATAWLCSALAARLFGPRAARLSFWCFALYPYSIYYSAYFFRETLMTALATAAALLSLEWPTPGHSGDKAVLAGATATAWLGMCNAAWLPAAALSALAAAAAAPAGRRARRLALASAPLVLFVGLWSLRNHAVFGNFFPGSTNGGLEFYQALVVPPEELGTAKHVERMGRDEVFLRASRLADVEQNAAFLNAGLAVIRADPGLYARRVAARMVKFWRLWPYERRYNVPYPAVVVLSLLSDGWIVLLGLAGLALWARRWRSAAAIPALILGGSAVFIAVHVVIRYRMPLMGILVVFACAAASGAFSKKVASSSSC